MCIYNTQKERLPIVSQQKNLLDVFPDFVALSQNKFLCWLKDVGSLQLNGEGTCERTTSLSVEQGRTQ